MMNKQTPLYQPDDIVLYIHRVTSVDFTPMKVIQVLGQDAIGMYWHILISERRALTGIRESWLKPVEGLTVKQIERLKAVEPRVEQLTSLADSTSKLHKLTQSG